MTFILYCLSFGFAGNQALDSQQCFQPLCRNYRAPGELSFQKLELLELTLPPTMLLLAVLVRGIS